MTHANPMPRRRLLGFAATALAVTLPTALLAPPPAVAQHTLPTVMALPDNWLPEGIATVGSTAYLGSRADGDILRLDLRTGEYDVFSQGFGPGNPAVGIEAAHGTLLVAGGPTGSGRLVDQRSGATLATFSFTSGPSFVNDVVHIGETAWFTDSRQPQLYVVSHHDGSVTTLPLTGAWVQTPDVNNANGIETTPDRNALLVINSSNGILYRVDPASGAATAVEADVTLTAGDGLLRQGRTLYVVQNRLNKIAVLRLSADGSSATLEREITSDDFVVPTTVARWGQGLYLPNAKFGAQPPATTFEVVRVSAR
jgi:sugar lactone lactonase YvrE